MFKKNASPFHFFSHWHSLKIEKKISKFHIFASIFLKMSTEVIASKTMTISRISTIVVWNYRDYGITIKRLCISDLILTVLHWKFTIFFSKHALNTA